MKSLDAKLIKATQATDGVWDLVIQCPYCHKKHRHGGGCGPEPSLGHRVPHCINRKPDEGDYCIVR
jgi:hypothetical protein